MPARGNCVNEESEQDWVRESEGLAADGLPPVLLRELVHERDVRLLTEKKVSRTGGQRENGVTRLVRHFELQAKTVSHVLGAAQSEGYSPVVARPACSRSSRTPSPPACKRSSRPP